MKTITAAGIIFACLFANVSEAQKKLEQEGGKDDFAVTTRMQGAIPGSRVIIESEIKLQYNTNMGPVLPENIGSDVINGINVDTLYFFLPPTDNKRRITISADGYSATVIPVTLNAKETYKYIVFDPLDRNTYKSNYEKGIEYLTKGLYDDAIARFEHALTCPDAPGDNNAAEKIKICKQCKLHSDQLNFFMVSKDWDNARNACMYLINNSPDNESFKMQLQTIDENKATGQQEKKPVKTVYFGKLTTDKNVNGTFLQNLRKQIVNSFTAINRLEVKDAANDDELRTLLNNSQTNVSDGIINKLKSLGADFFIYGNLNSVEVKKDIQLLGSLIQSLGDKKVSGKEVDKVFINYTLQMIDVKDGSIKATKVMEESKEGTDANKALGELTVSIGRNIQTFVEENFKIEGVILQIADAKKNSANEVYINLGSESGLKEGQRFDVFYVNNVAGRILRNKVADLKVSRVDGSDIALCKVTKGGDKIKNLIDKGQILQVESRLAGLFEF